MAVASRWVSEITNIALQFCLPAAAGFWLDDYWKTSPWLVVLGACFGFYIAGTSFAQMIKRLTPPSKSRSSSSSEKTTDNSGPSQQ
jgi:F0F1-type ATP synthase assembly protein I